MASRPLDGLVPEAVLRLLDRHGVSTAGELLSLSALDVCEVLNLSWSQAAHLLHLVATQVTPAFSTATDLLQAARHAGRTQLLSGLPALDAALRGRGLPCGALTELVGPSGAGKSQVCLSLAVQAAAPSPWGLQRHVIYVDTEGKFSGVRLGEISRARLSQPPDTGLLAGAPAAWVPPAAPLGGVSEEALRGVLGRVLLMHPLTPDALRHCLHSLPGAVQQHRAALVIVDSVAALARLEYTGSKASMLSRQEMLGSTAALLKTLAETSGIPVVVTNQVTSRMGDGSAGASHDFQHHAVAPAPISAHLPAQQSGAPAWQRSAGPGGAFDSSGSGTVVTAALGTLWAHSVNLRIVLDRVGPRRFLRLVKAPACAEMGLEYAITAAGVEQVRDAAAVQTVAGNVLHGAIANQIDYGVASDPMNEL